MQYVNAYIALLREIFEDTSEYLASDTSRGFLIGTLVLTPIFGSLFFFAVLVNAAGYIAPTPTVSIEAVQTDSTHISIELSNNQIGLNAAEIEIFYDPEMLLVTNLVISESLCEERFVITKEIDPEVGRIFYQCGTITPLIDESAILATISVIPLQIGATTIAFGANTNVLAHDGYGSNMTKVRIGAQFAYSS